MAKIIEAKESGFTEYPGGKVISSMPLTEWQKPEGAYIPKIEKKNRVMASTLYLKDPVADDQQRGFFEQSSPRKRKQGKLITHEDHEATLAHHGIPSVPPYNESPEAVLWVPQRKEITVVQFPQGRKNEGRVTQVVSSGSPPVEHTKLTSGDHLVGALGDLGFDPNDFQFLGKGTPFRLQTGVPGLLSHIVPAPIEELVEGITLMEQDIRSFKLPLEMGHLKHTFRAGVRRMVEQPHVNQQISK